MKKWNHHVATPSRMPFVSHAILKGWEEAQNSYPVGSVKLWRLELDFESLRLSGDGPKHIIVEVLRTVGQAIRTVVQGGLQICVDWLEERQRLTRTALAVLTKATQRSPDTKAPATGKFIRLCRTVCRVERGEVSICLDVSDERIYDGDSNLYEGLYSCLQTSN